VLRRRRAGRSALEEFRRRRRQALREEWQGWTLGLLMAVLALVGAWWFDGFAELLFAAVFGAAVTTVAFGWTLGFDVTSMPWYWGHLGERWTGEELDRLGDQWMIEHDVPRERGNWDHMVVGPPGVFLLDSKFFHEAAAVEGDVLVTGSRRYEGRGFRGPAVGLSEELERLAPPRPWVQAVVVLWAEFPQRDHQRDHVAYVRGHDLVVWLERQPQRIPEQRRRALFAAIKQLGARGVAA
jgi:hypothetical protein